MTDETKTPTSISEKFAQIELNFNRSYLIALYQIRSIVDDEDDPEDFAQAKLLHQSYEYWFQKLQSNPRDPAACDAFYAAVKDHHDLLMARDAQLFTIQGDLFANIFQQPGLNTPYIFDQLADGLDGDDENLEVAPDGRDGKDNMWTTIINVYRLCVLIAVYLKNDLVKEIIDMIMLSNPDITGSNIFEKVMGEFRSKRRLRKLIMKLMKSNEESFGDIFSSLQKVIATFSGEVAPDLNMKKNMDAANAHVKKLFDSILVDAGVQNLNAEQSGVLLEALQNDNQAGQTFFVDAGVLTTEQLEQVQSLHQVRNLKQLNLGKTVKDLGVAMESMCKALETGDEEQVKKVFAEAGAGLSLPKEEIEKITADVQQFEAEAAAENDDDDDQE